MAKKIDYKKFQEVIKNFNSAGVIEEKLVIRTKGLTHEAILELFMNAVEIVPEDKEKELPDSVIEFYNVIAEAQEKSKKIELVGLPGEKEEKPVAKTKGKKKTVKEEPEEKPAEKVKTKTKKKAEKEVKKTEKKEKPETDKLGARVGSGTSKINDLLISGATLNEISGMVDTPIGRIKNHIYALTQKGYEFTKKGEKSDTYYKIKLK